MASYYQVNIVFFAKFFDDGLAEDIAYSSIVVLPAIDILLWICPEKITKEANVGDFLRSLNTIYLIE